MLTVKRMLEAGVHFGHQTGRWNPKMRPYIFGARNGIYIINLDETIKLFRRAYNFVMETTARGHYVLFVGTKPAAHAEVRAQAQRCEMPFVAYRWPGGMLTNFQTVKHSITRLKDLDAKDERGSWGSLTKKEILKKERVRAKLERSFGGVKEMERLPGAMFVIDPRKERIAVLEGIKLGIPVVAIVDTNCDPDGIEYVIPGNDDAVRSIAMFAEAMADAVIEGRQAFEERFRAQAAVGGGDEVYGAVPLPTKPVEELVAEEPVPGVDVKVRRTAPEKTPESATEGSDAATAPKDGNKADVAGEKDAEN